MRNFQFLIFVLLLTFSSVGYAQKSAKPLDNKKLKSEINTLLKLKTASQTKIGIYAQDLDTGEVLINVSGKKAFNPASNTKLITSAAALDKLGAEKAWATRISAGSFKNGTVETLYLKSDGDPLIRYNHVLEWAIRLQQLGVKSIKGGIVVDVSSFGDTLPPGFDQFDEDASYRPDISSFSVNYNHVALVVEPTKIGENAELFMRPPNDHVKFVGTVKTVKGRRTKIVSKAVKTKTGTKITVSGTIGEGAYHAILRKRVDYPSIYGANVFKTALESVGIKVDGEIRNGIRPKSSKTLHFHLSEPLWYAITMMNKFSNNFIAEQIYQLIGADKSTKTSVEASQKIVQEFMEKATDAKGFKQLNGSGLYVGNFLSPKQIVDVLSYMSKHHTYPEYAASLAVAGSDGTLRGRLTKGMAKANARGKTGTLSVVSALSGYLKTKSGRRVAYSILFNDPPIHAARMRKIQDAMLLKIAEFNN